jgi:two-component system chemotaxis response regulator CheY
MLEKATVVVVDPSKTVRRIVAHILRSDMGCQNVVELETAEEAWDLISRKKVFADWIISSWELSGMSGFELLQKLRQSPEGGSLPFIMMTSHDDRDSLVRAHAAGVTDYLLKPFTHQELSTDIERIVSLRYRRRTPRYKAKDANLVKMAFGVRQAYEGSLVDISETDVLVRTPLFNTGIVCVYDEASMTISSYDEDFTLRGQLFRMERTPTDSDKKYMYAAFTIVNIDGREKAKMDRFIDALRNEYAHLM